MANWNSRRSTRFHAEIYDAIKNRDAVRAEQIMADVLDFAEAQTLAALGTDTAIKEEMKTAKTRGGPPHEL